MLWYSNPGHKGSIRNDVHIVFDSFNFSSLDNTRTTGTRRRRATWTAFIEMKEKHRTARRATTVDAISNVQRFKRCIFSTESQINIPVFFFLNAFNLTREEDKQNRALFSRPRPHFFPLRTRKKDTQNYLSSGEMRDKKAKLSYDGNEHFPESVCHVRALKLKEIKKNILSRVNPMKISHWENETKKWRKHIFRAATFTSKNPEGRQKMGETW